VGLPTKNKTKTTLPYSSALVSRAVPNHDDVEHPRHNEVGERDLKKQKPKKTQKKKKKKKREKRDKQPKVLGENTTGPATALQTH